MGNMDILAELKNYNLASYVGGKQSRAGRSTRVNPCPICGHNDCFTIFDSNTYKCYSCGKSGTIIDYVMDMNMAHDVSGAISYLCEQLNIKLPEAGKPYKVYNAKQAEIEQVFELAAKFYHEQLKVNKQGLAYMEKRGRSAELYEELKIGFAATRFGLSSYLKQNKISEEVQLASGLVIKSKNDGKLYDFFGNSQIIYPNYVNGKVCDFQCKYLVKDKDKPNYRLRNENRLRGCQFYGQDGLYRDKWIIVEGQEDRNSILEINLGLNQRDKYNPVAILGSLSEEQISMLVERAEGKTVYLCLDSDAAGTAYTEKLIAALCGVAQIHIVEFGDEHKDIDDYLNSIDIDNRRMVFDRLIVNSIDPVTWYLQRMPDGDLNPYQSKTLLSPIINIISKEDDVVMRGAYMGQIEKILKPRPKLISAIVKAVREKGNQDNAGVYHDDESDRSVSRRGTQYIKVTKDSYKIISDFVMSITRYIEDDDIRYYEVVLHTYQGQSKPLIMSNEQRINMRLFDAALAAMGPYYFYGSLNDLKEVWQLEEERADIKSYTCRFNRYGWIKDHGIWLFSNCAYKNGKMYLPEQDKDVIVIDGIGYQSKNVRVYGGDIPSLETGTTPTKEYVHEVINHVWDMWDGKRTSIKDGKAHETFRGFMAMGFMAACVYATEISNKLNRFPYLLGFGPPGTGKSEAMQFILNMWGFRSGGENWGEATAAGISMAVEQLSGMPYWLEEFSNTMGTNPTQQKKVELLKNIYNRTSSGKGGLQGRTVYEVNSTIFFTGQDRPENQALLSRCVILRKEQPTEVGSSGYHYLKAEPKKLTLVLRWLLENKSSDRFAAYWENYNQLMGTLKKKIKDRTGDYNERTATNIAIIATGFTLYDYNNAFDMQFIDWLVGECVEDTNRKNKEDIVLRFFQDIESVFHGRMKSVVRRTPNELYIYHTYAYNEWIKNAKQTGMQEYIGLGALLDYLRKDPKEYWIPNANQEGLHRQYFDGGQHRCLGVYINKLPDHLKDVVEGWDLEVSL